MNPFFAWSTEYEIRRDEVPTGTPLLCGWIYIENVPEHEDVPQLVGKFFRVPPELTDAIGNLRDDLLDTNGLLRVCPETECYFEVWREPETLATYTPLRYDYVSSQ